jgi:cytochrome c
MDDRSNTIAGWILGAGIVALGASVVTAELFHAGRPEKMGYPIEGVSNKAEDGAAAEQPIAAYLATADLAKGEQAFKKCTACHTANKGGASPNGPNLWGTVGAPVAHMPGFAYSADLKAVGGAWDWDKLSQWLKDPKSLAPKTKMGFAGIGKPEERANLIAWLNTQSDSPLPLPAPPAASPAQAAAEAADAGAQGGKAEDEPVLTEAQAAKQPEGRVQGEGAPATAGAEGQAKTKSE